SSVHCFLPLFFPFNNQHHVISYTTQKHHPLSLLFPYTTLFRSALIYRYRPSNGSQIRHPHCFTFIRHYRLRRFKQSGQALLKKEDRKSTRLNSSHEKISYAVFCLKKKIPITRNRTIYVFTHTH